MAAPATAWPISQYVLKVHSRCDLACDHCYIYEHADQSWRARPQRIDAATVRQVADRIAQHAASHRLPQVRVVLHGGEPLLLGAQGLSPVLDELVRTVAPVTRLHLSIHTNGVLLDEQLCGLFSRYGVRVGISLDGDRAANDRHRRYANGRSSHAEVLRALALLRTPAYQHLYAGILCTIDIANDPVAVYQALLEQQPPRIDFLLPHATWDSPPPRSGDAPAPYADWLGRILDLWHEQGRPVPIRLFDSIEAASRGGPSQTEAIGTDPADLLVIETDGTWEQVDSLKTAFDGAAATDMNVFAHSVDEASSHPAVVARQQGADALCATCRSCPVVDICGGGLYAHRYRTGSGFDNPSVYCADLQGLIARVGAVTPAEQPRAGLPSLRSGDVEQIAAGPVGAELIERIAVSQESLTRTLFAQVGAMAMRTAASSDSASAAAWELLCALDQQAPDALRMIYRHPHTRSWAVRCLAPPPDADDARDLMQLAAFAGAAAVRAGVDADLTLPVDDGRLYLPTLGAAILADEQCTQARLTVRGGKFEVDGQWIPTRAGGADEYDFLLEDLDPYRNCYGPPAEELLSDTQVREWTTMARDAVDLLRQVAPGYGAQLGAALRCVVPLTPDPYGAERSATFRHAFGAVGIALPGTAEALALLLVHEVQHMLFDAVLDLYDLFDPSYIRHLKVAWRPDPRPVSGVLHGAFAHVALAEVWQAISRRQGAGSAADSAELARRYATWSAQALDALRADRALTALGERFAATLTERAQFVVHGD